MIKVIYVRKWWIGCSGFHYKNWRGKFYPENLPQKKWFDYYCQYFNTLELNVTFYRYPRPADVKSWFNTSPEDFRFTVKAPRFITHFWKFKNAKRQTNDFYTVVADGLQHKLGCVLFQLHPHMEYSKENLERILSTIDSSFPNVLEFRHASWWRQDVYKTLKENKITFCGISYPALPDEVVKTAPVMYYRFHGVPDLYLSSYSKRKLSRVSTDIRHFRNTSDIYCYFNNDIEVAAVDNAKTLQKLVSPTSAPVFQNV